MQALTRTRAPPCPTGPARPSSVAAPQPVRAHAFAQPSLTGPSRRSAGACAAAAESGGGESGGDWPLDRLSAAAALNDLFYSPQAASPDEVEGDSAPEPAPAQHSARLLPSLPLWRVQWAAMPGFQEVLHVHVPHYTAMFERLLRQPRPWRYGHVLLPEGSKNLGNPDYALAPGSKAPLTGTLMEVLTAVRFGDGRLLILAVGVSRLRVVAQTQDLPYSRADCELLCDAEEQAAMEPLALAALESVQAGYERGGSDGRGGGEGLPLQALMAAVPAAAAEAAAAYSQAWLSYELSDLRPDSEAAAVVDGTRTADAQAVGRRLAALAGNEVVVLPFFDAVTSGVRADALAAVLAEQEAAADGGGGGGGGGETYGSALQEALAAQRPVLRQAEAAAYAQASSAAARCVAQQLGQAGQQQAGSAAGGGGAAGAADAQPPVLNTVSERGVETQPPEEVLGEEGLSGEPALLAVALRLEAALWNEIDAVQALASKLREHASPLPEGIQCLRPPSTPAAAPAGGSAPAAGDSGGGGAEAEAAAQAGGAGRPAQKPVAPPDYPAQRRVQRLSFACAALLASISPADGRQAWVEAGSVCARLRLGLAALRKQRQVLAAVVAVEGL